MTNSNITDGLVNFNFNGTIDVTIPAYYLDPKFKLLSFFNFAKTWYIHTEEGRAKFPNGQNPNAEIDPDNSATWRDIFTQFSSYIPEAERPNLFLVNIVRRIIGELPLDNVTYTQGQCTELPSLCVIDTNLENLSTDSKLNDTFNWENELVESFNICSTMLPRTAIAVVNGVLEEFCERCMAESEERLRIMEENDEELERGYQELGEKLSPELFEMLPPKLRTYLLDPSRIYVPVLWTLGIMSITDPVDLF